MRSRSVLLLLVVVMLVIGRFVYAGSGQDGPGVWLPWVMVGVTWPLPTATVAPTSTATPSVTPSRTATVTPTATATVAAAANVQIVSIDGADEEVLIRNVGSGAQAMAGWVLQSADGSTCGLLASQVFHFPAGYVLAAGAAVRVTSGPGAPDNPPGVLRWTTQNIWANGGDWGELRDDAGHVVSSYRYGSCR